MARISKKDVEKAFENWADDNGLSTTCWHRVDGKNVANIGAVCLSHNPVYGGYAINMIINAGGGQTDVTPGWTRYKASEIMAWFAGARFAKSQMDLMLPSLKKSK